MTDLPLARFVERLTEGPPGPAAGSAIAVTVAMAAALTEMTAGRCGEEGAVSSAAALRTRSLSLAGADADAVAALLASEPDDRADALARAIDVPLAIAETAAETATLAATLTVAGARGAAADAVAAVELARAGARVAARLALVNLGAESDDSRAARAQALLGT